MRPNRRKEITYVENWQPALLRGLPSPCHDCDSHAKNPKGYPHLNREDFQGSVARYLFQNEYGKLEQGLVIRHKCDNRSCINILHLESGTIADNNRDRDERGRRIAPRGEQNPTSKLTDRQAKFIILCRSKGVSGKFLAKQFQCSTAIISAIYTGRTWKHIESDVIKGANKTRRTISGSNSHKALLTERQAKFIILCLSKKVRPVFLAKQFNVNQNVIHGIKSNRNWKHLQRV